MQISCYYDGVTGDPHGRMDALNFGRKLKLYRKRRGITQDDLGAVVNLDQSTISGWERGAEPPRDWFIYADEIAQALGVSAADFDNEPPAVPINQEPQEDAAPVTPRQGAETIQQMIRRHFPHASPEQFAELQSLVEAFMQHNIQEMRAINRVGDVILQLAKERSGEGGDEDGEESAEEAKKRKPFRSEPEEFHGERMIEIFRQAF